jgi:DNA-binding GntR family transcriptional regulator
MRASDRAYERLRGDILDWRLEPGTVLAEVEQAARLGVSRTPIREALARLLADGLAESQGQRGLVVSAASVDDVVALFEVREALEAQAAALAALRRDPAVFESLAGEFRGAAGLLAQSSRDAYYDLVRRFDEAVDDAVGNSYLVGELRGLRTHLARIRRLSIDDTARLAEAASEHLLIVEAIIAGNSDLARSATAVHLHRSLANILRTSSTASTATNRRTA